MEDPQTTVFVPSSASGSELETPTVTVEDIITAHKNVVDITWRLMDTGNKFVEKAAIVGRLLITKKEEVGHGNWLPWLAENIKEFGYYTANDYVKAARYFDRNQNLPEGKALTMSYIHNLKQAVGLLDDKSLAEKEERKKPPFVIRCAFNKDPLDYDEMEWSSFVESLATVDEKRRQKGWTIQPPQ